MEILSTLFAPNVAVGYMFVITIAQVLLLIAKGLQSTPRIIGLFGIHIRSGEPIDKTLVILMYTRYPEMGNQSLARLVVRVLGLLQRIHWLGQVLEDRTQSILADVEDASERAACFTHCSKFRDDGSGKASSHTEGMSTSVCSPTNTSKGHATAKNVARIRYRGRSRSAPLYIETPAPIQTHPHEGARKTNDRSGPFPDLSHGTHLNDFYNKVSPSKGFPYSRSKRLEKLLLTKLQPIDCDTVSLPASERWCSRATPVQQQVSVLMRPDQVLLGEELLDWWDSGFDEEDYGTPYSVSSQSLTFYSSEMDVGYDLDKDIEDGANRLPSPISPLTVK